METFSEMFDQMKTWAQTEVAAIEGGVESFVGKVIPVLEADVVDAIDTFGKDLMGDAVAAITAGVSQHETASQITTSLIQTAETQGVQIAIGTAQTAAAQITSAAQVTVGAAVAAAQTSAPAAS